MLGAKEEHESRVAMSPQTASSRGRNRDSSGTQLPELLTIQELAGVLRTSPKAIYAMVERSQLPGVVRIGRRILIRRDALARWLDQKSPSQRTPGSAGA